MTDSIPFLSVNLFGDLEKTLAAPLISAHAYPWEILGELSDFIKELGKSLPSSEYDQLSDGVFAHKSAKIAPSASLAGPLIICEGAELRHCAFIRGSAIVGKGAVVGNSTEIKNSVLFDGVQVPHFNYVGDSVLGFRAHFGAGAITSNVRLDRGEISAQIFIKSSFDKGKSIERARINTHLYKCGAMIGDRCEISCNTALNPGTVLPKGTRVLP